MHDEMSGGLADATKDREETIKTFEELMAEKKKEVNTPAAQIEVEMTQTDELGMEIAECADDLEDRHDSNTCRG